MILEYLLQTHNSAEQSCECFLVFFFNFVTRICVTGAGTRTALRAVAGLTCCGTGRARDEKFLVRVNEC